MHRPLISSRTVSRQTPGPVCPVAVCAEISMPQKLQQVCTAAATRSAWALKALSSAAAKSKATEKAA